MQRVKCDPRYREGLSYSKTGENQYMTVDIYKETKKVLEEMASKKCPRLDPQVESKQSGFGLFRPLSSHESLGYMQCTGAITTEDDHVVPAYNGRGHETGNACPPCDGCILPENQTISIED